MERFPTRTVGAVAILMVALGVPALADSTFRRGDFDADGVIQISDAIAELGYLFQSGAAPGCMDAADTNDDGSLDITDPLYMLTYLFQSGPPTPVPGPEFCGFDPTADSLDCQASPCPGFDAVLIEAGHVLNRVAYGPTSAELADVLAMGSGSWITEQLDPVSIDESTNTDLITREDALIFLEDFNDDRFLVALGDDCRYFKGTVAPPNDWTAVSFDDTTWFEGSTGIGYGDGDDETVLADMQGNYTSVYTRQVFDVADPMAISDLVLRISYDDGFVVYLNGVEVGRANMIGAPPAFNALASSNHEAFTPLELALDAGDLVVGENVLAIQIHNQSLGNNDLSLMPELIDRNLLPFPPREAVLGPEQLRRLPHVRGIYARRQLQNVLAEFWENHFTSDNDKLRVYFRDDVKDSDGRSSMDRYWSQKEAAQVDFEEYEFFRENALGNFGDMVLYSATSTSMQVYLDGIFNFKDQPNENYAREIQELHTLGVDNGYVQADIEEVARCFTGWTIKKVGRADVQPFPDLALTPSITPSAVFDETVFVEIGDTWRYFKGVAEPSAGTTAWTEAGFDDSAWLTGPTGIGFGDGDDATVLSDMQGDYISVYMRREFDVADPAALVQFVLDIQYDDGFVAYLNGVEVARSESMASAASPPPFSANASFNHEAAGPNEIHGLDSFQSLVLPGTNVFAIQVHNRTLTNNDLSMLPRVVSRDPLPGSTEHSDRTGIWTFRFDPDQHDSGAKVIYAGTPYQLDIPAGRLGADGVLDGLDVINALVAHPSTAEHICIKLIQRFVSDDITLTTAHDLSAPIELRSLLADMIGAWFSTSPPGNIESVMMTMLDPVGKQGAFWNEELTRSKVKSPVEYINAAVRALDGDISGRDLTRLMSGMGMELFVRNDPDGWPERGNEWVDTGSLLARINFVRRLAANDDIDYQWDTAQFLADHSLATAEEIVDFFDQLLYQGTTPAATRALLIEFAETDEAGVPQPLIPASADYLGRVESLVGVLLSMPQGMFQ